MLRKIEIGCYRGLKDIVLSDIGKINVIIGENNSGKTSILEALQLFGNQNVLEGAISIARKRETQLVLGSYGRLMPFDMLLYSFPMDDRETKK